MTAEIDRLSDFDREAIHQYFGLTYSNYQVLPRTLMQSMPGEWQVRAVAVFEELRAAYAHLEHADAYIVTAATECEYSDLNEADMRELGVTRPDSGDEDEVSDYYYDKDGVEHRGWERILVPAPAGDPVPHYNRGRTYIAPRIGGGE